MARYGDGSASFEAAGREEGLGRLVDAFYAYMDILPEARTIRAMHGEDLSLVAEKLKVFLTAWLGGPNRYAELFGPISIPRFHAPYAIGKPERDAWLLCMQLAVNDQSWAPEFKEYFMRAIEVPAERVRFASLAHRSGW